MAQPDNQREEFPALGELDVKSGEFWMKNPWENNDHNLSGFERNFVLLNMGSRKLLDISHVTTADSDADSRGVAVGDLTGDGMPDLLVRSSGGGALRVIENRFPQRNWLTVSLRGVRSNSRGIGAKLKLEIGNRVLWRTLSPVSSFLSQLPTQVHFGLDRAKSVDRLTILWPSGERQIFTELPVNRHLRMTEGHPGFRTHFIPKPSAISSGHEQR